MEAASRCPDAFTGTQYTPRVGTLTPGGENEPRVVDAGRVVTLDGLRGLAVAVVVVHNAAWIGTKAPTLAAKVFGSMAAAGWVGVQLFFVLSGFLITSILLNSRSSPEYFRSFYLRRTLRIFPLYYVVLAATVMVAALLATYQSSASSIIRNQWAYWLYVSNWTEPFGIDIKILSHVWSLAVEEQFYLIWPVVVWLLGARRLGWLSLVLVIAGPAIRFALHKSGLPSAALYAFTIARWDALAAGALLAVSLNNDALATRLYRRLPELSLLALTLLLTLALHQRGFHESELPIQIFGQTLIAACSALLVAWALRITPATTTLRFRVLGTGILPDLGRYSYAIYLLHYPIHRGLQPLLKSWVNRTDDSVYLLHVVAYCLLIFVLGYAAARVSWVVIERPFLLLKERLAPRRQPIPAADRSTAFAAASLP